MLRLLLVFALPGFAQACMCSVSEPPCESAWKASAVFLGTVSELTRESREPDAQGVVQANGFLGTHAIFDVGEAFLGMEGRGKRVEICTGMGAGDCGYSFRLGQQYIVYAEQTEDGLLVTSMCSRTSPVEAAREDLAYLRSLKDGAQSAFVSGVVVNGESGSRYDLPSGVSGVKVTLTGASKKNSLITGEDGSFRFNDLAAGKYKLTVSKDGYILLQGESEVEVHPNGCVDAWQSIVTDRRITGKVIGADGAPASGIQIELVPTRPTDENSLPFPVAQAKTDDNGNYELKNIRSGEYYLGINLARTPSKEMPYARYFYPGTEDPSNAGLAAIGDQPGTKTFDFPIPPPQKERSVQGIVYWPDGRLAEKVNIFLEDRRWPWQTNVVSATTESDGRFKISVFDGTRYRIHAITMARFTDEAVSAEPYPIGPDTDFGQPVKLILTRKGHSAAELIGKSLERWRAGQGF
jgi:5-hydroxyisourate hydrolase-like protein (transthyretin family)